MKYLIGNRCINSDNIDFVDYMPAEEAASDCDPECVIRFSGSLDDIFLSGKQADAFWALYTGDAQKVMQ